MVSGRSATAVVWLGAFSGACCRAIIVDCRCLQSLAGFSVFNFVVSAGDNLGLSFTIGSFGLFEDIYEMLALWSADQLMGLRCKQGTATYCANRLARFVQDCYGLYKCCHVDYGNSSLTVSRARLSIYSCLTAT